jgi:hypothetical protein
MMVTDDHEELMSMFTYAVNRINKVYWENKKRINMQNYKVTKNCIEPLIHEPRKEDEDAD